MQRRYFQIIELLQRQPEITQREIAKTLKISLAYVNKIIFSMTYDGFLKNTGLPAVGKKSLTEKALKEYGACKVDNAIIMAAGFGSRFVPITYAVPKGLLEVFGERMIERQIKQLKEAGINDITIVVGYLKDTFEYLIDKYNVKLVFNPDYESKNNLSTLYHVRDELKNTYILSSDNWLRENMYHTHEYDSWYSSIKVSEKTKEWVLKLGLHNKITGVKIGGRNAWIMYGPVYFSKEFSNTIKPLLGEAYNKDSSDNWYWEDVYIRNLEVLPMFANKQPANQVYEFESLEELRLFDSSYVITTHNKWMELIAEVFDKTENAICNLRPLRFGMTNKSFLFEIAGEKYIFRIPGTGTEVLINREQEYSVYEKIKPLDICDKLIYFNPQTGVKITKFEKDSRNADAHKEDDLKKCMATARMLHKSGISVEHNFDFKERISFYEDIAESVHGILFNDYKEVKAKMDELLAIIENMEKPHCLTHIDLIPDNFILIGDEIKLIDWEYAGMCDPLADIAMFAIYSYYNNAELEHLMELYFERPPLHEERVRIYCYVALAGFLWTLWTCYKQGLGMNFGDYGLKMYRYAKDYYKLVKNLEKES